MNLGNALGNLPTNNLRQFPSGRWGFAGIVSARLCYICKDGSDPTDEQFAIARQHGPRLAGLKTRAFATKQEALTALEEATK